MYIIYTHEYVRICLHRHIDKYTSITMDIASHLSYFGLPGHGGVLQESLEKKIIFKLVIKYLSYM
jgi:hypothetical protein